MKKTVTRTRPLKTIDFSRNLRENRPFKSTEVSVTEVSATEVSVTEVSATEVSVVSEGPCGTLRAVSARKSRENPTVQK